MRYTDVSESIEGNALNIQCRKFNARPPCKDVTLGTIIFPFKLGILALATIAVELTPKACIWCETSHLDLGDSLQGEAIEGQCARPLGKVEVKPATAKHKASFLTTKGKSFARIEVGTRALLQRKAIES